MDIACLQKSFSQIIKTAINPYSWENRFSALTISLKVKLPPDPTPQFMLFPCDICRYHCYFACFTSQSILFLWIY